jgi:hypothetical protein
MKKIIFILMLLIINNAFSQDLQIKGLKDSYKRNETIKYSLTNIKNNKIIYFVGIAKLMTEWREIISDVENPNSKICAFKVLNPNLRVSKKINLIKLSLLKNNDFKSKYRLIISYEMGNDTTRRYFYSNSFRIRNK